MKLFKRKTRNPGCECCKHFLDNPRYGRHDMPKETEAWCYHKKNIIKVIPWRGGDWTDNEYKKHPWEKNRNRRCRDFEAKEEK